MSWERRASLGGDLWGTVSELPKATIWLPGCSGPAMHPPWTLPRQTWLGAHSGLTHFVSAGTCTKRFSYAGSMPSGSKLSTSWSTNTPAACLNLCSTTEKCQTAVLTTDNTCQLYTALAGARTGFDDSVYQCGDYGTEPASWPGNLLQHPELDCHHRRPPAGCLSCNRFNACLCSTNRS